MEKTIVIAEAGVNHNGDIDLAKKLVDVAAGAGADYVKFQTFKAEKIASPLAKKADYQNANMSGAESHSQLEMLRKLELSEADHFVLAEHCLTKKIRFLSTAFDPGSIDFLNTIGVDLLKIPSGEITNLPYLRKIGSIGKPVILSTGMSTLQEVGAAIEVLVKAGMVMNNITVLHCTTDYPAAMRDVNLKAMQKIRDEFKVKVGYSDHTPGIEVAIAAVALGASVIEKHFTLDRQMKGPDHKASLEPDELIAMVSAIRNVELATQGSGQKVPSEAEQKNIAIVRKSIHLASDMKQGEKLSAESLTTLRPGDGISPMEWDAVINRNLSRDLPAGSKLTWEDLA